jgi:hypothetical protein
VGLRSGTSLGYSAIGRCRRLGCTRPPAAIEQRAARAGSPVRPMLSAASAAAATVAATGKNLPHISRGFRCLVAETGSHIADCGHAGFGAVELEDTVAEISDGLARPVMAWRTFSVTY